VEDSCLTLGLPANHIFLDNIMEKPQKEELERIAGIYYSQTVTLAIKILNAPKAQATGGNGRGGKTSTLNEIKREAVSSPLLQKVLDEFDGAQLVEIKPRTDRK
jgi:hypothetical protein